MGDQPRSTSLDLYNIFGIKSLVTKWNPDKKSHKHKKSRQFDDHLQEKNVEDYFDRNEAAMPPPIQFDESFFFRPPILLRSLTKKSQSSKSKSRSSKSPSRSKSTGRGIRNRIFTAPSSPTESSSVGGRRSKFHSRSESSRSKSTGRAVRGYTPPTSSTDSSSHGSRRSKAADSSRSKSTGRRSKSQTLPLSPTESSVKGRKKSTSPSSSGRGSRELKKGIGKRSVSETEIPSTVNQTPKTPTPILYSQSTTWRTPQEIEMKLECTLEELCHGCVKKIPITRDVVSNGTMKKEEEMLTISVKPGWRKGTKIRFEGKGSDIAGNIGDIVFLIDEIQHPLFTRKGDDLEYGIEIPLKEALIGCSISVPLLGEEVMWLTFSDIIYPGFQKVLPGQGMPTKTQGKRGNLRLKFFVQFPKELTDQQRREASTILQACC